MGMNKHHAWFILLVVGGAIYSLVLHGVLVDNLFPNPAASSEHLLVSQEVKSLLSSLSHQQQHSTPPPPKPKPNSYEIDPNDLDARYFVYQPLSGWKHQRQMLRWAMRLANAMDRILILPNYGIYTARGYEALSVREETVPLDQILDLDALALGVKRGVRVYRGHLANLSSLLSPGNSNRWKRNMHKTTPSFQTEEELARNGGWHAGLKEQVVYWKKIAMMNCCAGGVEMTPYVMFHRTLKLAALRAIASKFSSAPFNAVHVQTDRYNLHALTQKRLPAAGINSSLPLVVLTEEEDLNWFNPLRETGFDLVFPHHLRALLPSVLASFPDKVQRDILVFITHLICARAEVWLPGIEPTFAVAGVDAMRNFAPLREVNWKSLIAQDAIAAQVYDANAEHKGLSLDDAQQRISNEVEK